MDLAWPIGAMVAGFAVAVAASRVAVDAASTLVRRTRIPPFVLGITLVAIGTDLPEIVNSVVASARGLGDINVGDSIGSAVTQVTLVLGVLPFLGGAFVITRKKVSAVGAAIVAALILGALLMMDGRLSRLDGAVLVVAWVVTSLFVWRQGGTRTADVVPADTGRRHSFLELLGGLAFITGGVLLAMWGIIELADRAGTPAYIISFFGASLGTSLPELVFDITALRRGQRDLAIGDVFGSSLVDATLSIGIGPALFPIAVTADLALRGSLMAAGVIGLVALLVVGRRRHDWRSGIAVLVLYAAFYPALLM